MSDATALARRQFIRTAALGLTVWAVPTVVAVPRADAAQLNSRPRHPVPRPVDTAPVPVDSAPGPVAQLPFTGDNQHVELVIGASALAAGAALISLAKEDR